MRIMSVASADPAPGVVDGRRQAEGEALAPPAQDEHVLRPLLARLAHDPGSELAARRVGDHVEPVTVRDVHRAVWDVAKGLLDSGLEPGDRVALMAHTRLEWLVLDLAIVAAGGITVPIYDTSSADQVRWILEDSGAIALVVETRAMAADVAVVRADVASCREVLVIDDGALDELRRRGEHLDDRAVDARVARLRADQLATIIYTSGTTGRPKGCMLTHGNLCANVAQIDAALGREVEPGDSGLLFLPLAHALTKGNALFDVAGRVTVGFATDVAHLAEELRLFRPTTLAAVPRIFEKVYNGARQHAHHAHRGRLFDRAAEIAVRWSREETDRGRPRARTAIEHRLWDRLVYRKLRDAFGGRLRLCFSGGGPLGERLTHFFAGVGVRIYEEDGLTETSPTLTISRPGAWKPGTVGRPVAGTSIRIADDGEILARGPQVFAGYWRNAAATRDVLDADGWLATGDIGELDDEGFLRITGRKKELIVTAAGKNVAPAPLEDQLRAHELISQAVVVGDARPFIGALIAIDQVVLADWAAAHGVADVPSVEVLASAELRAAVQVAVDHANRSVSRAESIRTFVVLPHDLTIEAGELTPTLKVRRAVVAQSYSAQIEAMYAGHGSE